jgi:hypothetical protein
LKAKDIFDDFAKPAVQKKLKMQLSPDDIKFDLLSITVDDITGKLDKDSAKYTAPQLKNLGDFLMLLPQDFAFAAMKKLALNQDIAKRLLLQRKDLFELLKKARNGGA